ncbi:variant leucine-rich repeat-containing protein [Brachybacterium sp. AOP43-C2-M15]|uniref:variant leucine-rich repeat-containing protein n=1 Tax=Brachybacterium sp. AOP43-C2-M15 TaxID=3457661 RepID=UPI004034C5E0
MREPRSTAQEAEDPSTDPDRLLELARKHPQLHRLLVLNPSTPEVARQWILATDPWAKRAYEDSREARPEDAAADGAGVEDAGVEEPTAAMDPVPEDPAPNRTPPPAPPPAPMPDDPDLVSAWGEFPDDVVWGGAGTTSEDSPTAPARTAPVRVSEEAGVVPLGPVPSAASSAASPAPAAAAGESSAAGPPARPHDPEEGDGSGPSRRAWFACGGCLVLALLLVLVMALVGRAWLTGDEEAQDDGATTSAEAAPSEEPTEETAEDETTEETTSADPVSPAPDDAQEMTELSSPTGNIVCRLDEDSATCSLEQQDYAQNDLEDCGDDTFSIAVAEQDAAPDCGTSALSDSAETLDYGESATNGEMACTSRSDGMTCWNIMTGKGFTVSRSSYETF